MDFFDVIGARRNVRTYLPEFVPPLAILPLGYAARPASKPAKLNPDDLIRAWR